MRMMHTPVPRSPAMIARWIGAAPRHRGRSEAWMFRHPRRGARAPARQDQPVGDDHSQSASSAANSPAPAPFRLRVAHRQAQRLGPACTGLGRGPLAAARRAGRLAVDRGDLVPGRDQRVERRHREIGCSHEDQPHCLSTSRPWRSRPSSHCASDMMAPSSRSSPAYAPVSRSKYPPGQMVDLVLHRVRPEPDEIALFQRTRHPTRASQVNCTSHKPGAPRDFSPIRRAGKGWPRRAAHRADLAGSISGLAMRTVARAPRPGPQGAASPRRRQVRRPASCIDHVAQTARTP